MPVIARHLLLAAVLALLFVPAARAEPAPEPQRVLLAFYYAWFDPDSFGPGRTSDVPIEPYNSDDPAVIAHQIEQARAAGIDGFIVSWLGPGNRTDTNLARVLEQAASRNFRVSVYVEVDSQAGPEETASGLAYLIDRYGHHPNFLRKDGRPVLFFWRQQRFSPDTWASIRAQVDPDWSTLWIAEGTTAAYFNAFDGLHLFSIAWAPEPSRPLATWAARTAAAAQTYGPRIWIPTIMPGYDDLAVRGGYARDRENGAYYQRTMEAALATDPQWAVVITSWNEWPEGSQIEPSASYGNAYLDLTAEFARRFKQGT